MKMPAVRAAYRCALLAATAFALVGATRLAAQTTPTPPKEEVLILEKFNVSTAVDSYSESNTSTATKVPMNMKDLAGTLQVLNTAFVSDKLALSLDDLYPYIVGMTRESQAASGFTLRGFTNNATNTLLNNIQFDGQSGGASRFGSPTTANVERVEVLKGPNSVLYGAMSPGGIINIVTKSPLLKTVSLLSMSASSYAGQNASFGDDAGYTTTLDTTGPIDSGKHWLYRFIASYEKNATWRQFDWGRNHYFFPSLTYRLDENTEVTTKVEVISQHRFSTADQQLVAPLQQIALIPSDHSIVYQDPSNTEYDRGEVYSLFARHTFANKWTSKFSFRDVQHVDGRKLLENRSYTNPTPIQNSAITQRLRDTRNRRRYAYYDWNIYGDVGPDSFKHTLLFGASYGYETETFVRAIFANVTGPAISVYNPVHNLTTYPVYNPVAGPTQIAVQKYYNSGFYFSDQIKIGKEWHASFGLHTDKYVSHYHDWAILAATGKFINPGAHNDSKSTVPSFGLVYQPTETMSLYANYSLGFKPSIAQSVDGFGIPRPPEKANQKEVGAKLDFLKNTLSVLLSIYDIERNNVTEAPPGLIDANGVQIFRTLTQESKGVELSVNYQPRPNIQMQIGYTSNDAKVTESAQAVLQGGRLANAPRASGNLWMRYNIPDGDMRGLGIGLGVIYTGERNGLVDNRVANMLTMPSNTRADLAIYYKWKRYDCAINITNSTDLAYIASADADTNVSPGAPRKISASVRYAF